MVVLVLILHPLQSQGQLVVRQVEDVFLAREETMRGEQLPDIPPLNPRRHAAPRGADPAGRALPALRAVALRGRGRRGVARRPSGTPRGPPRRGPGTPARRRGTARRGKIGRAHV